MKNTIWIPGVPQGQPRPSVAVRGGFAKVYYRDTKDKAHSRWCKAIESAVWEHMRTNASRVIDVPVRLQIAFIMPRPKGHYGSGKNAGQVKGTHSDRRHASTPDLDNMEKMLIDSMKALWVNDSLVWAKTSTKRYQKSLFDPCGALVAYSTDDLPAMDASTIPLPFE